MSLRCVDCLNEAIECCEVSGVALCAEHLWYVDDGRRVSERVAHQLRERGHSVDSPQQYLSQLGAEFPPPRLPSAPQPRIRILRNGYDLLAIAALALLPVAAASAWWLATGGGLWNILLLLLPGAASFFAYRTSHLATRPHEVLQSLKIALATTAILALAACMPLLLGVQAQSLSVAELFMQYAPGPSPTAAP